MSLHKRLNQIHSEIMCINFETIFGDIEGSHFSAAQRTEVRNWAAHMTELMDEYDKLDPVAPSKKKQSKPVLPL